MDLLNNSEWILTKNLIVKKAQRLAGKSPGNYFWTIFKGSSLSLPQEVIIISPKISKGENYNGLPWLMLDYPRYFKKEKVFAIRTMFLWGNFFSTTLHLSGQYKERYSSVIMQSYEALCENEFFTCINDEQWHHHFEKENYLPVKNFTASDFADHIDTRSFIKLSCQLSFLQWNDAPDLLSESFIRITNWLG
jgi:hypothetical protein